MNSVKNDYLNAKTYLFTHQEQLYRLKITLKIMAAILFFLLLVDLFINPVANKGVAITATICIIGALYFFTTEDTISLVSGMLIWALMILTYYMAWNYKGLFDSAMLAYPCILMLAITFTKRLLYVPLYFFSMLSLFFLAYAYSNQLMVIPEITSQYPFMMKAMYMSVILTFFVFNMDFIYKHGQKSIRRLLDENQQLEKKLQEITLLGNYDPLTDLPNERVCEEDLTKKLDSLKSTGRILAFTTLDFPNLRRINSSFGHNFGDMILKKLAARLSLIFDDDVLIYRFQGNEFTLLKTAIDYDDISTFAEQLIQSTTLPFSIQDYEIELTALVGIAVSPFDGNNLNVLRKNSHLALFIAKDNFINSFHLFDEEMEQTAQNKYRLTKALKNAIINKEFELYYQPKIELTSQRIMGAEALIRWNRPGFGMIPPDVFISIAEESGLINEITKWVAIEACKMCATWHQLGYSHISIAINLSVVDFKRGNLPHIIMKALSNANLPAHYLELEITESILIDDVSQVQSQLHELHSHGIKLAIDDFGTGYSNLGYLSKFNVSTLKIDQSFVRKIISSEHDYHIIKAIIQMSESLGITNVAEGIEEQYISDKLLQMGCQFGQGYLWSKPLPEAEFETLLKEEN